MDKHQANELMIAYISQVNPAVVRESRLWAENHMLRERLAQIGGAGSAPLGVTTDGHVAGQVAGEERKVTPLRPPDDDGASAA